MKCAYSQTIEIEEKNEMPLINKIKDIKSLIAEFYSDKDPLNDHQKEAKKVFFGYCKDIENALETTLRVAKDTKFMTSIEVKELEHERKAGL